MIGLEKRGFASFSNADLLCTLSNLVTFLISLSAMHGNLRSLSLRAKRGNLFKILMKLFYCHASLAMTLLPSTFLAKGLLIY